MKSVLLFLVLSVSLVTRSNGKSSNFIVGGDDASIEQFPYQARIMHFGLPVCSGTIINSRSVLTAAHCIFVNSAAVISFFVGTSQRFGNGGETYRALRVTIHPDYLYVMRPFQMENDLAVIRSISSIRFGLSVQPISLGTRFVSSGSRGFLSGWGLSGESFLRDRPENLQKLEMSTISNIRCAIMLREISRNEAITNEKLCSLAPNNASGCNGDSGSPIVIDGVIVGVLSWVSMPCGSHPNVFIRVTSHLNWIQQQI